MTPDEAAWVAGFLEGEGTFTSRTGDSRQPGYPSIDAKSVDRDVLEQLQRITGLGVINGPYSRESRPNHQPIWSWRASGLIATQAIVEAILPWLGERRRARSLEMLALARTRRSRPGPEPSAYCKRGHANTPENRFPSGRGGCKPCQRIRRAARA